MAIDRLRSPYNNLLAVKGDVGPSAYATTVVGGSTSQFVSDGSQINTIVGVTYRCHVFEAAGSGTKSITFSRGGNIDLILLGAGGQGGGQYANSSAGYGGGGGGGGGLIIQYGRGITNQTYVVEVGDRLPVTYSSGPSPNGEDSTFDGLTAIGGGGGGNGHSNIGAGKAGGSGGGAGSQLSGPVLAPAAGTVGQGFPGGINWVGNSGTGGGGGYTEQGQDAPAQNVCGKGGDGIIIKFDDVTRGMAAGGGGAQYQTTFTLGAGGLGGGAAGSRAAGIPPAATGYGCGGGGTGISSTSNGVGGLASAGLCIIRYAVG